MAFITLGGIVFVGIMDFIAFSCIIFTGIFGYVLVIGTI
jgi:hypothetical protein